MRSNGPFRISFDDTVVIELVHDLLDFTELVIEEVLTCNGQLLDLGSDPVSYTHHTFRCRGRRCS